MSYPNPSLAYGVIAALLVLAGVWWVDTSSQDKQLTSYRVSVIESADATRALLSAGGYALDEELFSVSIHMLVAPHDRERLLSYQAARDAGGSAPQPL